MGRRLVVVVVGVALAAAGLAVTPASAFAEECEAAGAAGFVVDQVECRRMPSTLLGTETAFSYYVPANCAASGRTCPTLYLLHGFGGSYTSMMGTTANPSALVRALTSAPPVDPHEVSDPWNHADPDAWESRDPIDFILIGPHGQTLPGGHGPAPNLDGAWADWNPRYAAGGPDERYPTPPPRFESFLLEELIPLVESSFPAGSGREWRALSGNSFGGFGSYKNGLQHPDVWSSIGSISGALTFFFTPWLDPIDADTPSAAMPVDAGYLPLPGPGSYLPVEFIPSQVGGFVSPFLAFGDPAVDHAYFRGNMPRDLALNARAWSGDEQSLHFHAFFNDAVPRRAEDVTNPPSYLFNQFFEGAVVPMNLSMNLAFDNLGVEYTSDLNPGIHSWPYWNAFYRDHLERMYAQVQHWDGQGTPRPAPDRFDYRTISTGFEIWGWSFEVAREPVEFLHLWNVSCEGLRLRGTGEVTVTVPEDCGTGLDGERTFTVTLAPSYPVNEPGTASSLPVYGSTAEVELTAL